MDRNLKPTTYLQDFNLTISNKQLNVYVMWEKKGVVVIFIFFFQKINIHENVIEDWKQVSCACCQS